MNIDDQIAEAFENPDNHVGILGLEKIADLHPERRDQIKYLLAELRRPPFSDADAARCSVMMEAMQNSTEELL